MDKQLYKFKLYLNINLLKYNNIIMINKKKPPDKNQEEPVYKIIKCRSLNPDKPL